MPAIHRNLVLVVSLLGLPCGCSATDQICDAQYFPDTVTFQLSPSITTMGSYTLYYTLPGGAPTECIFTFPYADITCPALSFGDAAHSTSPTQVDWIMLNMPAVGPDSITLSIKGFTMLFEGTVIPTYTLDEPNGAGCGVRKTGTAFLTLR